MNVSIQNTLEYKFDFLSQLFFSFIPFGVNVLIWFAISNYSKAGYGLTLKEMVTYYFIVLIVENIIQSNMQWQISAEIRTGDVNKYLLKTIDYLWYNFFIDLPKRLVFAAFGMAPFIIIYFILREYIVLVLNVEKICFFIVSVIIGYLVNFLMNYLISELTFYFSEVSSLFASCNVFKNICSGKVFPLSILSESLCNFFMATPFQYMGFFPAMIMLNKFTYEKMIHYVIIGVLWVIVLYIVCRVLWRLGLKKYSAYGG